MRRARLFGFAALAAAYLSGHAASGDAAAPYAAARIIQSQDGLVAGPSATAELGDYLLENELVRVVVAPPAPPDGISTSGGAIIDAALRGGEDGLTESRAWFGDGNAGGPSYHTARIVRRGGTGMGAELVLEGELATHPSLHVATHYEILPASPTLRVETTVTNAGRDTVRDLALGDAIAWGRLFAFVPGTGYSPDSSRGRGSWIAFVEGGGAQGADSVARADTAASRAPAPAYGWVVREGEMEETNEGGWSYPVAKRIVLAPGASDSYERFLVIAGPDVMSVAAVAFQLRHTVVMPFTGHVRDRKTRALVPGATIHVGSAKRGPLLEIAGDASGNFTGALPSDRVILSASAPGYAASPPETLDVYPGEPHEEFFVLDAAE